MHMCFQIWGAYVYYLCQLPSAQYRLGGGRAVHICWINGRKNTSHDSFILLSLYSLSLFLRLYITQHKLYEKQVRFSKHFSVLYMGQVLCRAQDKPR